MGERNHVIRKNGYFYRPDARGYCADVEAAGRWTKEDAYAYQLNVEGVTVHHISEFPPAPETAERYWEGRWRDEKAHNDALVAAMQEAIELLMERKHGNPARSAGHNARLCLESALRASLPSPPPAVDAETEAAPDDRAITKSNYTSYRAGSQ